MLTKAKSWRVYPGNPRFAAKGKKSYLCRVSGVGEFTINPVCLPNSNKHAGYVAYCCNVFLVLPGSALWWYLMKVDGTYSTTKQSIFTLKDARLACENFRLKFAEPLKAAA